MAHITPSLASADPLNLAASIAALGDYPHLHLDIEDGNFVDNITFGMKTVRAVAGTAPQALDAHLMTENPAFWVGELLRAGVKTIAFHVESAAYPLEIVHAIREAGGRAGLALNLKAPIESLAPYADKIDFALVMASEPDGEGQQFNPYAATRVAQAREILPARVAIAVDGGVNETNMMALRRAGAEVFVMGRAVWGAPDPRAQILRLNALLEDA